ncbi:MAG TPA: hypothetical protein VNZ61_24775 [Roseomonas sp.]|nr:hypothetical protein [Roseomonas sp.]
MNEVPNGAQRGGWLRRGGGGRASALALLLGLGACASSITGERTAPIADSLTVQRVLGTAPEVPPLQPVPGDVWPSPEADENRPTLGNRDLLERAPENPPPPHRPIPRGPASGSSTAPDLLQPGTVVGNTTGNVMVPPPPAPDYRAPQRSDGRVIPTPNGPVVTSGGGRGYSTYNRPGGGSGIAIPQGAGTVLLDSDGTVQQVPTPR